MGRKKLGWGRVKAGPLDGRWMGEARLEHPVDSCMKTSAS